jgi:predicted TPR repeat methyltransferase
VHQQAHVEQLLADAGFQNIRIEACTLRYEAGEPVQGFVASAEK